MPDIRAPPDPHSCGWLSLSNADAGALVFPSVCIPAAGVSRLSPKSRRCHLCGIPPVMSKRPGSHECDCSPAVVLWHTDRISGMPCVMFRPATSAIYFPKRFRRRSVPCAPQFTLSSHLICAIGQACRNMGLPLEQLIIHQCYPCARTSASSHTNSFGHGSIVIWLAACTAGHKGHMTNESRACHVASRRCTHSQVVISLPSGAIFP